MAAVATPHEPARQLPTTVLLAVVAVTAAMALVPVLALRHDRPAAFGWQMFVGHKPPPEVSLVLESGDRDAVDFEELVGHYRPELDYARRLTPQLCERYPEAMAVRYEREGSDPEVVRC